jgi:predicted GTPase
VPIVRAASRITLDDPQAVSGRRVLVVEDGPSLTHGGLPHGAGYVAARRAGAAAIVEPRVAAAPELRAVYARHPHIGPVLPAMGYGPAQRAALRLSIEASDAEVVVAGTPVDLARVLGLAKPVVRARYEYQEAGSPGLGELVDAFLAQRGLGRRPAPAG